MPTHYPFTAIVGGHRPDAHGERRTADGGPAFDDMSLALLLSAIAPEIGGVLVRGEKGTAKTTTVRGLAAVLPPIEVIAGDRFSSDPAETAPLSPDGPFPADAPTECRPVRLVELPVGATEDRVLGSLHLERALTEGRTEYEPGLLARAHRGILYVDEVNLLHDHLVDALLDAAATGRVRVERDGVSVEHAARFVLVGTMNPEEGELRPQLLDRFGLAVEVAAPRDPGLRAEVVRRRIAFDTDPTAFAAAYAASERTLSQRLASAQQRVGRVELTDAALLKIAEVCAAFDVDGLRADLVTARAAVAHAAWCGRDRVRLDDIRVAARLALPHRRRRAPFDAPGLDEELLDRVLGDDEPDPPPPGQGPDDEPGEGPDEGPGEGPEDGPGEGPDEGPGAEPPSTGAGTAPDDAAPDSRSADAPSDSSADPASDRGPRDLPDPGPGEGSATWQAPVSAGSPYRARQLRAAGTGRGPSGRRSRALTDTGRRVGSRIRRPGDGPVDLLATLLAAVPHQPGRGRVGGALRLRPDDLRTPVREGREANLVLFCVDASGSLAARRRMEQVKTAILSLLLDAYRRRDKVGLITFAGGGAQVALPPTRSVDVAAARLDSLPAGGRTPLAEGLLEAARTLSAERRRDPRLRPLLVVVTDGRATAGPDAVRRSRQAADLLAGDGVDCVVVDCESGPLRLGLARTLAGHLRAQHLPIADLDADRLAGVARLARDRRAA